MDSKDPQKDIVDPSVKGTENVLASVAKSGTIKRFVQTSSVAAVQSFDKPEDHVFTEEDWNTWSTVANGDAYGFAKAQGVDARPEGNGVVSKWGLLDWPLPSEKWDRSFAYLRSGEEK